MNIATVIQAWRKREELTIRQAAERIGIDRNSLYRLECGKSVRLDSLAALMRFLFNE